MIQQGLAHSAQRGGMRLVLVVGTAVAAILGAGAFFAIGAGVAAGHRLAADGVMEQARRDNNQVSDSLSKLPDLTVTASKAPDPAQAKTTIEGYLTRVKQSRAVVNADIPKLRGASDRLRGESGSFLVASQRATLDQERGRVDSLVAAFTAAGQFLQISEEQLTLDSAIVDLGAAFTALSGAVQRQDFNGAIAQYPQMDRALQQAMTLAKTPSTPPQLRTQVNTLATAAADLKQLVQAAQRKDLRTINALGPKLDADTSALDKFDQQGASKFYDQLFKPYLDRYDTSLRQAGFKVV
jgi:hypothetical protein